MLSCLKDVKSEIILLLLPELLLIEKYLHIQYIEEMGALKRLCQAMANTRR